MHTVFNKFRKSSLLTAFFMALSLVLMPFGTASLAQHKNGAGQHGHGADGTGHNMRTMPGLMGLNATPEESAELAVMFRNFRTLSRTVENLPNGIRTITRSSDPDVMDVLVSHVVGMIERVENGDDPKIRIQSPTLDIFFSNHDEITSQVDLAVNGIVVVQTSENPDVVAALQEHAKEVTAMVDQGMHAVHMMMMQRAQKQNSN